VLLHQFADRRRLFRLLLLVGVVALVSACSSATHATGSPPTTGTSSANNATGSAAATACTQPVKIGATYSTSEAAGLSKTSGSKSAAAAQAKYASEEKSLYQTMATYINTHGGLGTSGCQVQMTYFDFDTLTSAGEAAESQLECAAFGQDQHIFADIPSVLEAENLIPCLAKNNVITLWGNTPTYYPDPQAFSTYKGYLYEPDQMGTQRLGSAINLLSQAGYFGTEKKVGILLDDNGTGANENLVNNLWVPALAKLGITADVFTWNQGAGTLAGLQSIEASFNSAVLRFKSDGITRVLDSPDDDLEGYIFPSAAASQHYFPHYAMFYPELGLWTQVTTAAERAGSMGISTSLTDLGALSSNPAVQAQLATNPSDANRTLCQTIYKGFPALDTNVTYNICDAFLFLQSNLAGAHSVTPQTLLTGVNNTKDNIALASGYGNGSMGSPNHYDGAAAVRVVSWNESQRTWQYVTPPISIPPSS
jgi:hypothetical protein